MRRHYNKRPMAVKTSQKEAATRKVERMLMDNSSGKAQKAAKGAGRKPMAVKTATPARRVTEQMRRKTDAARKSQRRLDVVKKHFKSILSGKSGRMQGNK